MILTYGNLQDQVIHFDRDDSPAKITLIKALINQRYQNLCLKFLTRHRRKFATMTPAADISSSSYTAAIVIGTRTVTITGYTPTQADVLKVFTPSGSMRGYLVTGVSGAVLTLEDLMESATDTSVEFTLRKQFHLTPHDFESWDHGIETQTPGFLFVQSRDMADKAYRQNATVGAPFIVVDAGKNWRATYNTGLAYISQGSDIVTLTTGVVSEVRDYGQMFCFRNDPHPYKIIAVSEGGNTYQLDRTWHKEDVLTPGLKFDVNPIGRVDVVEFWPIPIAYSVRLTYYAKPSPMVDENDVPNLLPDNAHPLIVQEVLEELGLRPPGGAKQMLKEIKGQDPIDRNASLKIPKFGQGSVPGASNLPKNFPPYVIGG